MTQQRTNRKRILEKQLKQLKQIKKEITEHPRGPELQNLRDLAKAQTAVETKLKLLSQKTNNK